MSGRVCALKKVKMDKERDGFPLTSIREINILLSFQHPNIVNVTEARPSRYPSFSFWVEWFYSVLLLCRRPASAMQAPNTVHDL